VTAGGGSDRGHGHFLAVAAIDGARVGLIVCGDPSATCRQHR